jgi:hypothetical protein
MFLQLFELDSTRMSQTSLLKQSLPGPKVFPELKAGRANGLSGRRLEEIVKRRIKAKRRPRSELKRAKKVWEGGGDVVLKVWFPNFLLSAPPLKAARYVHALLRKTKVVQLADEGKVLRN